jgi:hypothetical protein
MLSIKDWVRHEWLRSGLPMSKANDACGVANAATRKYLTQCHLWYFPPPEAIVRMAEYCNKHGRPTERPYFSLDGHSPVTEEAWGKMRAKWTHTHGITNVWQEQAVHGRERIRTGVGYLHANQKPLASDEAPDHCVHRSSETLFGNPSVVCARPPLLPCTPGGGPSPQRSIQITSKWPRRALKKNSINMEERREHAA